MIPGTAAPVLILLIAREWITIPFWLFCSIIGVVIVKDIVMFPFVWRAYDTGRPGISRSMTGARGIAVERLAPTGFIDVQGELWKAECIGKEPLVEKGEIVIVKKRKGLKLFVELDIFEAEKEASVLRED